MGRNGSRSRFDIHHGTIFDRAAVDYDRYRPAYPDDVIDDVVRLSRLTPSSRLLEIGCGTGKATVQFASRGYAIDCVDPGRRLVALAARKCQPWTGVSFTVGKFEDVALQPRLYDLVFSAQAFHWIEPRMRLRKAGLLLARGGSLALIYNYPGPPEGRLLETLSVSIERESRGRLSFWSWEDEVNRWSEEIDGSRLFKSPRLRRRRWQKRYSADEYLGLFCTFSDFLSLERSLQGRVASCIHRVISENGGSVVRPYECVLIHARKKGEPDGDFV